MKSLEEFRVQLQAALQRLGPSPSVAEVERAGSELVADGVPDGANLEGLLLLRELAELREQEKHDDPRS